MKVQRVYIFLVVLFLITSKENSSAQATPLSVVPLPVTFKFSNLQHADDIHPVIVFNGASVFETGLLPYHTRSILEPDYYTRHFGYFCKKELQFENATAIPLRFRLGTLDYVNRLEGK